MYLSKPPSVRHFLRPALKKRGKIRTIWERVFEIVRKGWFFTILKKGKMGKITVGAVVYRDDAYEFRSWNGKGRDDDLPRRIGEHRPAKGEPRQTQPSSRRQEGKRDLDADEQAVDIGDFKRTRSSLNPRRLGGDLRKGRGKHLHSLDVLLSPKKEKEMEAIERTL